MANELFLDIRFLANEGDLKSIESKLSDLEGKANKAKQGSGGTKTTKNQAKAERELIQELRRKIILNETEFRQGKKNQQQALKNAQAIETEAIEQGVLTNETLRGVQAQKQMFLSQQRIETGFTGMAKTSQTANRSLVNLGRIVQDLPFGFLGISNNIDPALNSFRELKEDSGGVGGAFKQLLGSLKGSGGLIFALGSLLPTAVLIAQKGFNFYAKQTKETDEALQSLNDTARSFISESADLRNASSGFLNIFDIQAKIESTNKLVDIFDDTLKDIGEQVQKDSRRFAAYGQAVISNVNPIREHSEELKNLKEQFQLTDEDIENINKTLKEFQSELRTAKAIASRDPLALFRDDIERTVEQQIEFVEAGLQNVEALKNLRRAYTERAIAIRESNFEGENALEKYMLLRKNVMELNEAIDDNTMSAVIAAEASKKDADAKKDQADQVQRLQDLLRNQPDSTFDAEPDSPESQRQIQRQQELNNLLRENKINAVTGLEQKILEIELEFERRRQELRAQFGAGADELIAQERIAKEREIENAKTEETRKGEQDRQKIRQQAIQSSFQLANNFISSLSQLNQAQSDETERQARRRFEAQKKLSMASAIVSGASAVVKTYENMGGFPAALPFVAGQIAATAVQLAAIQRTQFNDASFNSDSPNKQSGFFETDAPNRTRPSTDRPIRPQNNQPINISLEGEFDDEMVSVKAERGKEKRLRGAIFTL